jgi:pimeloyl-ACP methyl ester carboxylesterase
MSDHPILLLPGMMLDADVFAPQIPALRRLGPVITGDLTGAASITDIAVRLLRDAPPRFAVVGLSMGGIVAMELWRRARDRISHIALLDTTPHAEHPDRMAERTLQIEAAARGGLRDLLVGAMKPRYLARRNRGNRNLLHRVLEMGLRAGPDVFRDQSLALRDRADSNTTIAQIDCPALVLCGREDELCPPIWHQAMATSMPRADLIVLSDCGHLPSLEAPTAVTHALTRLLRRTP